jgi:hypothetical protein
VTGVWPGCVTGAGHYQHDRKRKAGQVQPAGRLFPSLRPKEQVVALIGPLNP